MIPSFPHGPESHLFRQDIDAFLWTVALRYGATGWQNTSVETFDISDQGVEISTTCGRDAQGAFLIDASGFGPPVAHQLGLRDTPTRLLTHSRGLFGHLGRYTARYGVRDFLILAMWGKFGAPEPLRRRFFDFGPTPMLRSAVSTWRGAPEGSPRRPRGVMAESRE